MTMNIERHAQIVAFIQAHRRATVEELSAQFGVSEATIRRDLEKLFWQNINPEQADGQFYDRGSQYKTYVYYGNAAEKKAAEKSKADLLRTGKFSRIVTEIVPVTEFWPAEDYHQDYYKKNPDHYYRYRTGSGRDDYIKSKWGR